MTDYLPATVLDHVTGGLTERDQLVLESIGQLGWMLSGQVARLHFVDDFGVVHERRCRDVLARLRSAGWLSSPDRRVGSVQGGSSQHAYTIDLAGQRFLNGLQKDARRRRKPDLPAIGHALAVTEIYVRLVERERLGQLHSVGFRPEFDGLGNPRPDAMIGVVPASGDVEQLRRWFLEVELSRKDAARYDEKLDAYVDAWRHAESRLGWSRFPRVLWAIGTQSRFPADATATYRDVEAAIRRQLNDARPLFALARYEDAAAVLAGLQEPTVVAPDSAMSPDPALVDPAELVMPRHPSAEAANVARG